MGNKKEAKTNRSRKKRRFRGNKYTQKCSWVSYKSI